MRTDPPAADPRDVPHAVPRAVERDPAVLFAPPRVERVARADGCVLLRSPDPLGASARSVGEWLEAWAARAPDRTFLAERDPAGAWRTVGYADALARVRALGTWLLERGLGPERPLAILSDNGVDHALLSLADMHRGEREQCVVDAVVGQDRERTLRAQPTLEEPGPERSHVRECIGIAHGAPPAGRVLDWAAGAHGA